MSATSWRLLAETLEARILHSADLSPLGWSGAVAVHAGVDEATPVQPLLQGTEIAFVDATVPDADALIADLRAQQGAGRRIEVVTIEAGSDGIALIGQTLAGRSDIGAVHVLAHGSDGRLQLGSAVLDADSLLRRADELAAWSAALTADADLLLYGCDLAQGADGQRLVQGLAALTGADVAASTDLTGAAARGGNWTLEYRSGAIEAPLAPSTWQQAQWQGVLATYTVTLNGDFIGAAVTPGTLRWAISQANANPGADRIQFSFNGTINVSSLLGSGGDDNVDGDFDINGSLEIVGNGSGQTIIAGNGVDRVFDVRSGTVTMSGLTIQGGASNTGAGLRISNSAALTLTDVVVQSNVGKGASKGGGIYNDGTLTLTRVTVQNNGNTTSGDTDGAGIYNDTDASLNARDVTVAGNVANGKDGGGIFLNGGNGSVALQNVTLSGNTAKNGGGLHNRHSGTTLGNVTVAGNTATAEGGGVWSNEQLTLDHVTIAANSSPLGGGVFDDQTSLDRKVVSSNSLFASNTGGNTNRALTSLGYNLSDDNSLGFTATGDLANTAAGASALANNGGATRTVAIAIGSAARDAANPGSSRTLDQRGIAIFGSRADIGAYEYNPAGFAPTITALSNRTINEDQALSPLAFTVSDFETSAGSLVVTATSSNTALVPNGSLVLGGTGANRSIGLTPALNANSTANGTATITVSVFDGGNTTSTSFVLTVNAVNDRPTITLPASLSVDEDTALVLTGAAAPRFDDVDAGNAAVQVTLAVAQGRLTLSQITGLAFVTGTGSGDLSMRFSGSITAINAALQGLRYLPGSNFNGNDRLELSINDLGNSGAGGALSASAGVDITVLARNDAPTLSLPGPQATAQPTPLYFSAVTGNAITLSDVDAGGADLKLTLDVANGTIGFGSLIGLTLLEGSGASDTRFVARGSVNALNAALDTLRFNGTTDGAARIDIAVDDLGNSGAGTLAPTTGTVAISVSANARPVLTLGSTTLSFTEGDAAVKLDPALTVSDADSATLTSAEVRISAGYSVADVLAFVNDGATMGDISGVYSAGVLTLTSAGPSATPAQWQAALQAVTYFNASDAPSTATRTLSLTVNDGNADSAAGYITLTVLARNDAPVLTGAANLPDIDEDSTTHAGVQVTTLIAGFVSDVDSGAAAGIAVVGVDDSQGVWQYTTDGGLSWMAFGTVSDSQARLLQADELSAVRFVPAANWNGTVSAGLRLRAWDQTDPGSSGIGNASSNGGSSAYSSFTASASIVVRPVNDAPVGSVMISGTPAEQQTLTASHTLSDADGPATLAVSYQWRADGVDIAGATGSTLVLGQAQVGRLITVVARYTDADGSAESVASAATAAVANVNDLPTGSVTISGTAAQGQTLTASHSLADADGPATLAVSYQWQADGVDITGATDSTLLLGQAQVGKTITVIARYVDDLGTSERVDSAATAAVANVNDLPSGSVTISGSAAQGQTLTASHTLADADGPTTLAISYQWQAGGIDIAGATTSTLLLSQAQVGQLITVIARYTDAFGTAESVTSAATAAVANVNDLPSGGVTISGTPVQGQTLTASHNLADADGPSTLAVSYQWQAGGIDIAGATTSTLLLSQAEVGKLITVIARYNDAFGTVESVTSAATAAVANVNDLPSGSVTISGTPVQGQTLTASHNLADADGPSTLAVSYQWQAGGVDITGATGSTLLLSQAQVGQFITVVARYTDAFGTAESVSSAATAAVANVNDLPIGSVTISGTAAQGQTLIASHTLIDADGPSTLAVSYQWQAGGVDITGATGSTLLLSQAQVGQFITVIARYTDAFGTAESVTSAATAAVANVNDLPSGGVTISGTPVQGQTLTASHNLADADGPSTLAVSYQWQAGGVDITGATGSTLLLSQAQVGQLITVIARYTDAFGTAESVTSAATAAVANVNDLPSGSVTISGTPVQGQTLTASHNLADADGPSTLAVSYQWQAGSVDITGATGSTLLLSQAQVGQLITVVARYTDAFGTAESVTSAATTAVANVNDLPTGSVTISGTAKQGDTLTAAHTLADADGPAALAVSYQWQAGGIDIAGATTSTLLLSQADVGQLITVIARYTDALGTAESVTSAATTAVLNVNDLPTGSVTISGTSAQGQTLTASNTLADADGPATLGISYQWQAGGVDIAGATGSTLLLGQAQVGQLITVIARYTDAFGTAESAASAATAAVANVNDAPTGSVTISGTPTQGQTLTAANSLADADGLGAIGYQWKADGVAIGGATGSTLLLTQAQVGKVITVTASYTDVGATDESVSSLATAPVTNINDAPTGSVTISGTPTQGQTLTASHTLADADGPTPLAVSYQWQAGGIDIAGATGSTLLLGQAEVGKPITVIARYTDAAGNAESVTSAATAAVANVNDAPVLAQGLADQTATPGTTQQLVLPPTTFTDADPGDTLSFSASLADGAALPAWIRFDAASQVFTISPPLGGETGPLWVRVLATDAAGASAQLVFAVVVQPLPAEPLEPAPAPAPAAAAAEALAPAIAPAPAPVPEPAVETPVPVQEKAEPGLVLAAAPLPVVPAPAATSEAADERAAMASNVLSAEVPKSRTASRSDAVLAIEPQAQYTDLAGAQLMQLLKGDDMLRKLDELKRQMSESSDAQRNVVASSVVVTTGLSVGYVVWLVRGGVLVSSMLSALPAWQLIDPMPVLAAGGALARRRAAAPIDEPEVERLFDDRAQAAPPTAAPSETHPDAARRDPTAAEPHP